MTCGMVSPTMIQKASMPPKALAEVSARSDFRSRSASLQGPLSDGYRDQTRLAKAQFRVDNNKAYSPIHSHCKGDKQYDTSEQTSLTESVGLANNSSSAEDVLVNQGVS